VGLPPNRIDLITQISGVEFAEAWESRIVAMLDGIPVAIVSREVLMKNKRASGRTKDIADLEALGDETRVRQ